MATSACRLISVLALLLSASVIAPAAPVQVDEADRQFDVTDEGGGNPRQMRLHQITVENDYLRITVLPQLGGRLATVFDKAAGQDLFLKRPIEWPKTRYTAYGSQLGGLEVNFPCFHHGNNFMDQWNWDVRREADGSVSVFVGWTEPDSRNRVVQRFRLRPGDAVLRSHYRFSNLNPLDMGFAPWSNTFFGYADDLQYIIPTPWVAPHGFNDATLRLMPWPWPDWDDKSLCFWRNIPKDYNSVFAVGLQENFHGVYYTQADHGMARLFDRTALPGVKMYCVPPAPDKKPAPSDYTEVWTGPATCHEDAQWWEAYAVREYEESFFGIHGIGGYRFANEAGAVNLRRGTNAVELGVCVTRPLPGAVVILSSMDGAWWVQAVDLSPERPLRHVVNRAPGREPLELRVLDADGNVLIRREQRPDPGPHPEIQFGGKPLWSSSPYHAALKAEQYHALWRGPTGGYGDYGAKGIAAFRKLLEQEPGNVDFKLGLARSLVVDAQLRKPGKPMAGTADEMAALAKKNLEEAASVLQPLAAGNARAAVLQGEVRRRQGDFKAAMESFKLATGDPLAEVGAAMAAAAAGDIKAAAAHSEAALRAFPGCSPVIQLRAGVLLRQDRPKDAAPLLTKLMAKDPLDAVTLHLLALTADKEAAGDARRRLSLLQSQTDEPFDIRGQLQRLGLGSLAASP